MIAFLVNTICLLVFGSIGFFVGKALDPASAVVTAVCFGFIWLAIYVAIGLRIVRPKEFIVIERLGKFLRVQDAGWTVLCLPDLIDRLADVPDPETGKFSKVGSFKIRQTKLYTDEAGSEVDFEDASASVDAKIFWRVEDAYKFTYDAKDPVGRLREMLDGLVRIYFADFGIDEAQKAKATVAEVLITKNGEKAREALKGIGILVDEGKGLVVSDINIPPDIQNLRKLKLEGEKEAQKWVAKGGGYGKSIKAVASELGVEVEEATRIYETQRGFEVLEGLKANTTFVSPDVKGILVSVGAGRAEAKPDGKKGKGGNP